MLLHFCIAWTYGWCMKFFYFFSKSSSKFLIYKFLKIMQWALLNESRFLRLYELQMNFSTIRNTSSTMHVNEPISSNASWHWSHFLNNCRGRCFTFRRNAGLKSHSVNAWNPATIYKTIYLILHIMQICQLCAVYSKSLFASEFWYHFVRDSFVNIIIRISVSERFLIILAV